MSEKFLSAANQHERNATKVTEVLVSYPLSFSFKYSCIHVFFLMLLRMTHSHKQLLLFVSFPSLFIYNRYLHLLY